MCSGQEPVFSWHEGKSEVEFLVARGDDVIPIEVKSGVNTKAKSLQVFRKKYTPEKSLLLSGLGANQEDDGLAHAPLYLASETLHRLKSK